MSAPSRALVAAVVGGGPAGFYAADALLRRAPGTRIDIFERLPTPFGLVRSGVAPDHQGTKAVIRQFERILDRPEVRFFGGVEIGGSLDVAALSRRYDLVVLATGASAERRLAVPGEDLPGVYRGGEVVRWLNGHPDFRDLEPVLGRQVVVIGAGNVALDIARLLAKTPAELASSDLCAHAQHICGQPRRIVVAARAEADGARFAATELHGLAVLASADVVLAQSERIGLAALPETSPLRQALSAWPATPTGAPCVVELRFGLSPQAVLGPSRAAGVIFRNRVGELETLPADTVVTAIGAFAPARGEEPENVVRVGWAAGEMGPIPASRTQAARQIEAALAQISGCDAPRPVQAAELSRVIDAQGWRRIDAAEVAAAEPGRPREKIVRWSDLEAAAANETNAEL